MNHGRVYECVSCGQRTLRLPDEQTPLTCHCGGVVLP